MMTILPPGSMSRKKQQAGLQEMKIASRSPRETASFFASCFLEW
jgi:hypothetical protein